MVKAIVFVCAWHAFRDAFAEGLNGCLIREEGCRELNDDLVEIVGVWRTCIW